MKRGIVAAIILTLIIAIAVTINVALVNKADRLYTLAQQATDSKSKLYTLDTEWKKQIIYFELFTDHGYFENIDKRIKKLTYLDGEAYRIACTETAVDFCTFKEHLAFSIGNIF